MSANSDFVCSLHQSDSAGTGGSENMAGYPYTAP